MNGVAPCWRAKPPRRWRTASSTVKRTTPPPQVRRFVRGRSTGRRATGGSPPRVRRQKSTFASSTSPSSHERCQWAKSAYCTGSSASGDGRPSAKAA